MIWARYQVTRGSGKGQRIQFPVLGVADSRIGEQQSPDEPRPIHHYHLSAAERSRWEAAADA